MNFMDALNALQNKSEPDPNNPAKDRVMGIYQEKNPTNVITWDGQKHQFITFYTHKPQVISRSQLFAKDWEIIIQPALPEKEFTQCPLN